MRRFISLTILSLSLAVIPAAAQYGAALYPGYSNETPGMALVDGWVRRYIGRARRPRPCQRPSHRRGHDQPRDASGPDSQLR